MVPIVLAPEPAEEGVALRDILIGFISWERIDTMARPRKLDQGPETKENRPFID